MFELEDSISDLKIQIDYIWNSFAEGNVRICHIVLLKTELQFAGDIV